MLNVLYILEAFRNNNILPGLLPGRTRRDIEQLPHFFFLRQLFFIFILYLSLSLMVHPGRSRCMMLLCLSASRIYNTLSIQISSRKKKGYCSISFLVHPGRSLGMKLSFLSPSRIYNTISIFIRSRKKKRLLFYILSGSPRQKSWQDVTIPERFQNI